MADFPKFFDPQTLARLKGLRLRARHIVEGYVSGLHRSPFRGFSIEFAEHREYAPGDDLRFVDWKVFGRSDKLYVKQYEDETNLVCHLVLDASESMTYRGPQSPLSKFEYAQCAAASLAWLVLLGQDSVGATTFDSQLRGRVPPGGHPAHLQPLLELLESPPVEGAQTAVGQVLHELAERLTRRGVVVVLSDLLDDPDSVLAGLRHFRHRRHDLIVLHVLDAAELEFPFRQPTLFRGLEHLPDLPADPRALRTAYREEVSRFQERLQSGCRAEGADYLLLRTDEPLDVALSTFLAWRAGKVR